MSGLYNAVLGDGHENERGCALLAAVGEFNTLAEVGRYRDCWVEQVDGSVRIAVYTRNGGNNRLCVTDSESNDDCGSITCYGCIITHRLPVHPAYLSDQDDVYDSTYATVYFRAKREYHDALLAIAVEPINMSLVWESAIARLQGATQEEVAAVMERVSDHVQIITSENW